MCFVQSSTKTPFHQINIIITKEYSNKGIYESADSAYTLIMEKLAFFEPELLTMSKNDFERFVQEEPKLALYEFLISSNYHKPLRQHDHRLAP